MAGRFFFFTDPGLLGPQTPEQAFGPVAPSSPSAVAGKDRFRVTDLHVATATAPVFAFCDALVCAQADGQGTLSLILKPTHQPPFDFPSISHIIYKGIDPASLMSGTNIALGQTPKNDLTQAIDDAWNLKANGHASGSTPTRSCLGLHLNPTGYPVAADRPRFADGQPLDTLFFNGDPDIQLPLVRAGARLGTFSTAAAFGMEIVVARVGWVPTIGLARTRETLIEVDSLTGSGPAANDPTAFAHWRRKEKVLGFVDPCALWGGFLTAGLRVWDSGDKKFKRQSGADVYDKVLRGSGASAAHFANRNRAWLDIRDEHGNSLDYYKADDGTILLTLDAAADLDAGATDYYGSGWPLLAIDSAGLPAAASGDHIDLRLGLPATDHSRPLVYLFAGHRDGVGTLKDARRFIDRYRRADLPYLEEMSISLPLASDAGGVKLRAGYSRLYHFKRPLVVEGVAVTSPDAATLAPAYAGAFDHLFLLPDPAAIGVAALAPAIGVVSEAVYVPIGTAHSQAFVAQLAVAQDAAGAVALLLTPVARLPRMLESAAAANGKPLPRLSRLPGTRSLAEHLEDLLAIGLRKRTLTPGPGGQASLDVLHISPGLAPPSSLTEGADGFVGLFLTAAEFASLKALAQGGMGPATLSLRTVTAEPTAEGRLTSGTLTLSNLAAQTVVARQEHPTSITVRSHARV